MSFGMAGYSSGKDAGLELRGHGYWLTTIYWVLLKQPDKHNPTSLVVLKSRTMRAFGTTSGGGVELATRVSCGKYLKADIGTLSLSAGRLSFETDGTRLFDVSLESIEKITWHWYSFSGAFEARIAGVNYFLSFVPRNSGLSSWHDGLTIGRQWRAALEGRPMPKGPPLGARIFLLAINLVLVFFLICFLILTLGTAVDPHQTTGERILSGVGAALAFLMLVIRVWQGVLALRRP